MNRYSIKRVDGFNDDISDDLKELHALTFGRLAPPINPEIGVWWIANHGFTPVGFCALEPSTLFPKAGYISRVGVLPKHRGNRLQNRFMRVMEAEARRLGWSVVVSDTTSNPPSANCFIRRGYQTFNPKILWSLSGAIYWRKRL